MPDRLTADELTAAWGTRAPAALDRAGRVALLGAAAQALLRGELPDPEARLFLAGGLAAWLDQGGSLERDYFQVHQRGSHRTPCAIWRSLIGDERRDPDSGIDSEASLPSGDSDAA